MGSGSKKGPDVGLDFTDQPAPSPHVPQQPPATPGDDLDYPGYDDPHVEMPVDDEDMPPPNSAPEPDLGDDPIELGSGPGYATRSTVDYRGDSLLALVAGDDDVLIRLPSSFAVPSFVPLDGDGFASWLTKQDKIKAGTITQEMQRKYAKEIRAAKLEEFKSYLDNDAIRLTDRRQLHRDVNFLTGRWVLTVKVDKNGYFSKFKARWVCRGFQDKFAWDQQTRLLFQVQGPLGLPWFPG
eukprot:s5891_g1.t1